jgi:hypothetical protein
MTVPHRGKRAVALLYGLFLLTVSGIYGQTPGAGDKTVPAPSTTAEKSNEGAPKHPVAFGLRVRALPAGSYGVMDNGHSMNTTTVSKTNYDWNYSTTDKSFPVGGGLAFEAQISRRTLLTTEVTFTRLKYNKVTDEYWGTDDPTTSNDERSHINTTENTSARVFDAPVLLHWSVRPNGLLSHLFLSGGATLRNVSSIRTTNNITYADATKGNNTTPAQAKRTLVGGTVGVGFRFVDEFNIKVTPEVRYTRWNGQTFSLNSTQSPRNQLEVGIAFTR